jgi:hypothetical protein
VERDLSARASILAQGKRVTSALTLEAVHLATAEELGEPPALVTIITRDARIRDNARALGCAVE